MADAISLTNTGLPLAALAALAVVVPRIIVPRENRSQKVLLRGLVISATVVFLAGMAIFALLQVSQGADLAGAFTASPLGTLFSLAKSSAQTALFWAPVLGLNWLGMAQAINKRLGEDLMREGRGRRT